jgi:thiamine-monophosphate kinase
MKDCASLFDAQIIGGDTNEGEELVLSGTALGLVDKKHFMARKGARVGDIVAVTGELGSAGAGFHACKNNLNYKKSLRALMQPTPRVNEGIALSKTNAATGSMDISDGLAISLHQLSEANNVGFEIEWEKIPISEETKEICEKTGVSPEELALYFGGDYEVLVTIKPDKFTMAQRTIEISGDGTKLTAIGLVTEAQKGILLAYPNDKRKKIGNRGYEHFTKH